MLFDGVGNEVSMMAMNEEDGCSSDSKLQDRIRSIFDVANNGIIVVDQHGMIVIANRVVADIVGVAGNELIGYLVTDVLNP